MCELRVQVKEQDGVAEPNKQGAPVSAHDWCGIPLSKMQSAMQL